MNISETFGQRLKQARTAAKHSQPSLASLCGWDSQSRISMYERGERTPSFDDMEKLAKALNISICSLISGNYDTRNTNNSINEPIAAYDIDRKKQVADFIDGFMKPDFANMTTLRKIDVVLILLEAFKDDAMKDAKPGTIIQLLQLNR